MAMFSAFRSPVLLLLLVLNGCAYHQMSPQERGVSFPLAECTNDHLQIAAKKLKNVPVESPDHNQSRRPVEAKELRFDASWVCVTAKEEPPVPDAKTGLVPDVASVSSGEKELRREVESQFLANEARANDGNPLFGVALSGGGSKASAFGMGVMAGLADLKLLDRANYISSVSGGSYASYFYFTHKVVPLVRRKVERPATTEDLYSDCFHANVGTMTSSLVDEIEHRGGCRKENLISLDGGKTKVKARLYREWDTPREPGVTKNNLYQGWVSCNADVFKPGNCSTAPTSQDIGISFVTVAGTLISAPVTFLPNFLFDWGIGTSPAARTYKDGIGVAYGTTPSTPQTLEQFKERNDFNYTCDPTKDRAPEDCTPGIWDADPVPLTFEELRRAYLAARGEDQDKRKQHLPFWIINATAPENRMSLGLLAAVHDDTKNIDMFEMTAVSHGSGRYGYVPAPMSLHRMSVLDAVSASAAFSDSNQYLIRPVVERALLGMFLQAANFEWGYDIGNYNVSDGRRYLHKALPFPLYYLDGMGERMAARAANDQQTQDRIRSPFIRLTDGGNGENLGAFALIKRGVKNIIISDAATDPKGTFGDICGLAKRVSNAPENQNFPRFLYVPGLGGLAEHCRSRDEDEGRGYELHQWNLETPVLLGCIRTTEAKNCDNIGKNEVRLFIVKPAVDLDDFMTNQVGRRPAEDIDPAKELNPGDKVVTNCWYPYGEGRNLTAKMNCTTAAYFIRNWSDGMNSKCTTFPQHDVMSITANSSMSLYTSYRDLARHYVNRIGDLLTELIKENGSSDAKFREILSEQVKKPVVVKDLCTNGVVVSTK
jgi:hypothetical protein